MSNLAKRSSGSREGPPPHWVLQSLQEEPDSLSELWVEHRESMAAHIPNLITESVLKISTKLQEGGLPKGVADLIAESLPCVYLNDLEQFRKFPRNRTLSQEMEAIRTAASSLHSALDNASGWTLGYLRWEFLRPRQIGTKPPPSPTDRPWEPLPKTEEIERLENAWFLLFGGHKNHGLFLEETRPNPRLIYALEQLARSAEQRKERVPIDKGGRASGDHDPFGARAREWVALEIHGLLQYLNLPCGTHKDGPVAEMLEWVHEAANFDVLLKPHNATERVPAIEKELETQGNKCEWP